VLTPKRSPAVVAVRQGILVAAAIALAVALVMQFSLDGLFVHFPRTSQPGEGLVVPYEVKNVVVYVTEFQSTALRALRLIEIVFGGLLVLGAFADWIWPPASGKLSATQLDAGEAVAGGRTGVLILTSRLRQAVLMAAVLAWGGGMLTLFYLDTEFMHYPKKQDPEQGLVFPYVPKGKIVYITEFQRIQLDVVQLVLVVSGGLIVLSVLVDQQWPARSRK
jgi:hypothetical protein